MKMLRRSRWLARLAGCTALATGAAGMASALSQDAQAQVTGMVFHSDVAASWGLNLEGELGDGTTADRSRYGDIKVGNNVVQVAAGYFHALAVRSDGTVWAWGDNADGQLGDGTRTNRGTPAQVTGLTGVFTQVAAGPAYSLALRSDGTVWAWGDNQFGQLGNGTTGPDAVTPGRVAVLNGVTRISAGYGFALALRSDGIVFAWGLNDVGELGNSTMPSSPKPVKIAGLSQVTGIAAGENAAVATESSGISAATSVWTWGANEWGQLGDGTTVGHATPGRVTGIPASVAGVAAGTEYTAILGADGSVWGMGYNGLGQLNIPLQFTPVTRPVNGIAAGSGITQISAGDTHVLALKSNGTVLAWGSDISGELGNGTVTHDAGPVQVTGLTDATQIAAGYQSSYAVHTVPYLLGS
jgi:alpha-tubulin suppressor-like RCC1 family protein